jgi:hypothetical protein
VLENLSRVAAKENLATGFKPVEVVRNEFKVA